MKFKSARELVRKKCVPCEGGVPKLSKSQSLKYLKELSGGWMLMSQGNAIRAEYRMRDFQAAIDFINRAGKIAEREGHHPDFHLTGYRKLAIELSTHAIGGLSENDFILAAKIDRLPRRLKV